MDNPYIYKRLCIFPRLSTSADKSQIRMILLRHVSSCNEILGFINSQIRWAWQLDGHIPTKLNFYGPCIREWSIVGNPTVFAFLRIVPINTDVDFHGSHHCNLHSILHYFSLWKSVYSKRHSQFLLFQLQHDRESNDPFWEAQNVKKMEKLISAAMLTNDKVVVLIK